MKCALDELTSILAASGMDTVGIDLLLGRFLEEEAFDYVEYMIECVRPDRDTFPEVPAYRA
jgi:hypothetical protein